MRRLLALSLLALAGLAHAEDAPAACASAVVVDGRVLYGNAMEDATRLPPSAGAQQAIQPGCNDGGPLEPDRQTTVTRLRGIPPSVAVRQADTLYIDKASLIGLDGHPLRAAMFGRYRPPSFRRCRASETDLRGRVLEDGTLDVAFPAYAREHGSPAAAGVLLAALAAGIGIGSFLTGLRPPSSPATRRYPSLCGPAALGLLPLLALPGLAGTGALAVLAGLCFAPATTTQIGVLDEVAPRERPAEAFAWLAILYGAGSAAGAALAGQLVEADGPRAAIVAACAATAAACLITTARARTLSVLPGPP